MDLKELVGKYRELPRKNRMLAAVGVGLLYPGLMWLNDLPPLENQLEAVIREENEARAKYEKTKKEQDELPKLEVEFKFVQDQLAKAKTLLPEKVAMEDILSRIATIARETRVSMNDFSPAAEKEVSGDYRYAETPIAIAVKGGFGNVMGFYDRIVHLAGNIRLRGMSFSPDRSSVRGGAPAGTVDGKVTMVVFRSTDSGQATAPKEAAPKPKRSKGGGGGGE